MNSDFLQSKWSLLHVNFARDPKYLWFRDIPKNEFIAYEDILL